MDLLQIGEHGQFAQNALGVYEIAVVSLSGFHLHHGCHSAHWKNLHTNA